ncbi:MAK10-like protein [Tanacetum coccineum]
MENANPPPTSNCPILPAALCAQAIQELHERIPDYSPYLVELLEEADHVFGLADETKSYPVGVIKNVEVHIGKLKLLEDFYVIDMEKGPAASLLVGTGFLASISIVIDYRKAKIVVGEGVTRSIF